MGSIVILSSYEYHFIRLHDNLVQHPIDNISISMTNTFFFARILEYQRFRNNNILYLKKKNNEGLVEKVQN